MDERRSAGSSANGASEQAAKPKPERRARAGAGKNRAHKNGARAEAQAQVQVQEAKPEVAPEPAPETVKPGEPEAKPETKPVPTPDPGLLQSLEKQLETILAQVPEDKREEFKAAWVLAAGGKPAGQAQEPVKPAEPAKPETKPEAKPAEPTKTQAPPAPAPPKYDLKKLGVKRKFAGKLPEGYQREAPGLLYVPTANVDLKTGEPRMLEGLGVEVTQWGGHAAIVYIPDSDVRVIMPDGTPFENVATESTSRDPIVIPVDGDTTNIARDLMEDPEFGIVFCMVPSFEQPLADGTMVTRHLVGRGEKIPKKGIWPPE